MFTVFVSCFWVMSCCWLDMRAVCHRKDLCLHLIHSSLEMAIQGLSLSLDVQLWQHKLCSPQPKALGMTWCLNKGKTCWQTEWRWLVHKSIPLCGSTWSVAASTGLRNPKDQWPSPLSDPSYTSDVRRQGSDETHWPYHIWVRYHPQKNSPSWVIWVWKRSSEKNIKHINNILNTWYIT